MLRGYSPSSSAEGDNDYEKHPGLDGSKASDHPELNILWFNMQKCKKPAGAISSSRILPLLKEVGKEAIRSLKASLTLQTENRLGGNLPMTE